MRIIINQVLGIEHADIILAPLALVAGVNGAGKSSILATTAAALTGRTQIGGLLKKESKSLVRDGADGGRVTISDTFDNQTTISWPDGECRSSGSAPTASPIAAGLVSLLDMDARERAQTLDKLLKGAPSPADFAAELRNSDGGFVSGGGAATVDEAEAMKPLGLTPIDQRDAAIYRIVKKVWAEINVNGFDGAHSQAKENGALLKGQWRQITGETYGSTKAASWQPSDQKLVDEIVTSSGKDPIAILAEQVQKFEELVETTARNVGAQAALLQDARDKVAKLPELLAAEQDTRAALDAARMAHRDHQATVSYPPLPEEHLTCPHCNGAVILDGGKLAIASGVMSAEAIAEAKEARAAYDAEVARLKAVFDAAYDAHRAAEAALKEARQAEQKLQKGSGSAGRNASGSTGSGPQQTTEDDVKNAKQALELRRRALEAASKKIEADKLHRRIRVNEIIAYVLSPEGLRRQKLSKVLESFNESFLLPLCQAAGWKPVQIGADMEIRYGGRLAREPFISESQVLRTRIILQVAAARIDQSACVLIDRADKLDPAGRNGLFTMLAGLAGVGIQALVAMTYAKPAIVPDIAGEGWGASYWVSHGVTMPLAEAVAAAAAAKPKQAAE
jgi:hypothetical protein